MEVLHTLRFYCKGGKEMFKQNWNEIYHDSDFSIMKTVSPFYLSVLSELLSKPHLFLNGQDGGWQTEVNSTGSDDTQRAHKSTPANLSYLHYKHPPYKNMFSACLFLCVLLSWPLCLIFVGMNISFHPISTCKWKKDWRYERDCVKVLVYTSVHFLSPCFLRHVPLL